LTRVLPTLQSWLEGCDYLDEGDIVLSNLEGRRGLVDCQLSEKPLDLSQRAYLDLVPILTGEGVHRLLLEALLAL
jgi:hypothetical protein